MTMRMTQTPEKALPIAGFPVRALTSRELLELIHERYRRGRKQQLFFVNTNFVIQCEALLSSLKDDSVLLVNDGLGMDIASRLLHGQPFPANLNGTDFVPYLLNQAMERTGRSWRVFLFGGKPGVADRAAEALVDQGVHITGTCDGYTQDNEMLVRTINKTGTEVVLVARGNPLQERWIMEHRDSVDAGLLIGVGALLDFLAGDKPRAPVIVQKARLEWLYRLSLEPSRLFRRYTLDIVVFLARCYRYRRGEDRA